MADDVLENLIREGVVTIGQVRAALNNSLNETN
jgi:hypothetical protein